MRRLLLAIALLLSAPQRVDAAAAKESWAGDTHSPTPGLANDPKDRLLVAACGGGIDATLVTVAASLAADLAIEGALPDAQEIEWRQRKAGNPHVWARTWGAKITGTLERESLAKEIAGWLGPHSKRLRCGVATHRIGSGTSSKEAVAIVAVDPMADLAPLPTHAKVGAWLDVDATLLHGTNGRVVVLPPVGAPKSVISSTTTGIAGGPPHVKARFPVGKPGRWVLQILADTGAGPRPVLEAEVFVGVDAPEQRPSSAVPGEDAGDVLPDPEAALLARLNGARAAEGLPPLARDKSLDELARAHAREMKKTRVLGHDVGDGDPAARVADAGLAFKVIGENVAKAKSERAAHRALYASPSHRANLLETRFRKVGIAVVSDPKTGDLWVAQLFGG